MDEFDRSRLLGDLIERGRSFQSMVKDVEEQIEKISPSSALPELVRVECDGDGSPVGVRLTSDGWRARPEALEVALRAAIVEAAGPRSIGSASTSTSTESLVSETVSSEDGYVCATVIGGRIVDLGFAPGFIAHRSFDDVARAVVDICSIALGRTDMREG